MGSFVPRVAQNDQGRKHLVRPKAESFISRSALYSVRLCRSTGQSWLGFPDVKKIHLTPDLALFHFELTSILRAECAHNVFAARREGSIDGWI